MCLYIEGSTFLMRKKNVLTKNGDTLNLSGSGRQSAGIAYKIKVHSPVNSVNNNNVIK